MLFNEILENCSVDKYVEVDNTLVTSEGVDVSEINWQEKLRNECIEEVLNEETTNPDLEDEDKSQESSSSSIITPKEALSLLDKVHLFATYNVNNEIKHRIDDIRGHPHSTYAQKKRGGVKPDVYDCVRGRGRVSRLRKYAKQIFFRPQNLKTFLFFVQKKLLYCYLLFYAEKCKLVLSYK